MLPDQARSKIVLMVLRPFQSWFTAAADASERLRVNCSSHKACPSPHCCACVPTLTAQAGEIAAIRRHVLHQSPVPHSSTCPFKLHPKTPSLVRSTSGPRRVACDHVSCLPVALLWGKISFKARWLTFTYPPGCATVARWHF